MADDQIPPTKPQTPQSPPTASTTATPAATPTREKEAILFNDITILGKNTTTLDRRSRSDGSGSSSNWTHQIDRS